jgi:hypothetical protein
VSICSTFLERELYYRLPGGHDVDANKWNEKYGAHDYFYGLNPNDFLKEGALEYGPFKEALCLGEGEGRNALFLMSQGTNCHSIDLSSVGLEKLMSKAGEFPVACTVEAGSILDIEVEKGKYDLVTAIWLHGDDQVKKRTAELASQALMPGGFFILEAYTPDQIPYATGGPKSPELMYTSGLLNDLYSEFEIIKCEEKLRDVQEGTGHFGKSAVVQFIARKK